MMRALCELPNEIILEILGNCPPLTTLTLQQVSRRFSDISQPLLWRHHCRSQFIYWSDEHNIDDKFSGVAVDSDWKRLYYNRHKTDHIIRRALESILTGQRNRLQRAKEIIEQGFDAKDTLQTYLIASNDAEDVLARR